MKKSSIVICLFLLTSCAINVKVDPLNISEMTEICLKENPKVSSKGFLPAIIALFNKHGVRATSYTGPLPETCRFHGDYTANWRWDLALFLFYAEINVYEGGNRVGRIEYDARKGGGNLDKFGTTISKLEPLFERLFANK